MWFAACAWYCFCIIFQWLSFFLFFCFLRNSFKKVTESSKKEKTTKQQQQKKKGVKGNFRRLVLRRVYWNIFTSSTGREERERGAFFFSFFFVLFTLRACFIIRSNKAGENFLVSSEPVWKPELVTFPAAPVKNGCRRTMEGSTMPPQGLLRQVWLLLLFCPFFMLLFLYGTLSTAEKKEKTSGGGIMERSRPYHISLDGKFPPIYLFFSFFLSFPWTSYYSGQAVYSAWLWKRGE